MPTFALAEVDWNLLLRRIRSDLCIPFLGAGASMGQGEQQGLPTAKDLAEQLASQCDYPGPDKTDLLRVAQYFQILNDPLELRLAVARELTRTPGVPGTVHRSLASLPFTHVLTTNFDGLMERAFSEAETPKTPTVGMYQLHGDRQKVATGTVERPLVYKLHGSLNLLDSLVISEDDVVEFLSCIMLKDPPLPEGIQRLFEERSILFVGYGLKDWNIRVLLRAIRGRRAAGSIASFAIQRRPEQEGLAKEWEESVGYWDKKEGLRCFDMDAVEFCEELQRRFEGAQGRVP